MLTRAQLLEPLARHRTNEVVVTTMSVTRAWGRLSDHDLDFASTDSAMGHAAALAVGSAPARPRRTVGCREGDGGVKSMGGGKSGGRGGSGRCQQCQGNQEQERTHGSGGRVRTEKRVKGLLRTPQAWVQR